MMESSDEETTSERFKRWCKQEAKSALNVFRFGSDGD